MEQLDPGQMKEWMATGREYLLVDVREAWEHEAFNIGGLELPMGDIMARLPEIPKDKPVVLYCEKGIRSVIAIQRLESIGYNNLYNLTGGMKAWRNSGA